MKNPKFPIWVLASETHLTVFFSKVFSHFFLKLYNKIFWLKEQSLVQKDESPRQNAIKNFRKYDTEGKNLKVNFKNFNIKKFISVDSGFVKTEDLQRLMESLDLVVETE